MRENVKFWINVAGFLIALLSLGFTLNTRITVIEQSSKHNSEQIKEIKSLQTKEKEKLENKIDDLIQSVHSLEVAIENKLDR